MPLKVLHSRIDLYLADSWALTYPLNGTLLFMFIIQAIKRCLGHVPVISKPQNVTAVV